MANGTPTIAALPISYRIRHTMPRHKSANSLIVCEESLHRVLSWSAEQAPLIATMTMDGGLNQPPRPRVEYRAARMADGAVRMVAPLDSMAFANAQRGNLDLPANYGIRRFSYPSMSRMFRYIYTPRSLASIAGGVTLGSERAMAMAYIAAVARGVVSIDDRLHMSCSEPGFRLDTMHNADVFPDLFDSNNGPWFSGRFAPFREDGVFINPITRARTPVRGDITQVVAGSLRPDIHWGRLRLCAIKACMPDAIVVEELMEAEMAAVMMLRRAVYNWPTQRNPGLIRAVEDAARVTHGNKSVGNSSMLDMTVECVADLAANPAPMALESRLELEGVVLPRLPRPGWEVDGPQAPRI